MIGEKIPELKSLSPEEKLILVGELWDEFAGLIRTLSRHGGSHQDSPRAPGALPTAPGRRNCMGER
jgi:hypothetical protein